MAAKNTSNTNADATNDTATETQLAAKEQTPKGVAEHVANGGRMPDGWAYNNQRGFFQPGKVSIPVKGPVVVED